MITGSGTLGCDDDVSSAASVLIGPVRGAAVIVGSTVSVGMGAVVSGSVSMGAGTGSIGVVSVGGGG